MKPFAPQALEVIGITLILHLPFFIGLRAFAVLEKKIGQIH
jgi:hypothetical protein